MRFQLIGFLFCVWRRADRVRLPFFGNRDDYDYLRSVRPRTAATIQPELKGEQERWVLERVRGRQIEWAVGVISPSVQLLWLLLKLLQIAALAGYHCGP